MRIEVRDRLRRRIGRVIVDPAERPTRATVDQDDVTADGEADPPREVFLNWETALDDAGRLRRCVACGCPGLFHEKAFPQITGFVVVLAFAGAALGLVGSAGGFVITDNPIMLVGMLAVLLLDVAILIFSRTRLVCYRCRTSYHDLPIARYHRSWDRPTAERYPPGVEEIEPSSASGPAT